MSFEHEIIQDFCQESSDLLLKWESICLELSKQPKAELYQDLFRVAHNIKGGSRAVGLMKFGDFVHQVEDGITLLRENKVKFSVKVNAVLLEAQKKLQDWIDGIKKDDCFELDVKEFLSQYASCFSVVSEITDTQAVTGNTPADNNISLIQETPKPEVTKIESNRTAPLSSKKNVNDSRGSETIRISARKLDQLIQTIGEISIQQSILWHKREEFGGNKRIMASLQLNQKFVKDLYDDALSLRMQPISNVFQKLERNVLDLSKSLNKNVSVEVSGSDVELDKSVIERIADPLMHIVRNAIDHGIESAEQRLASGKSDGGNVHISATKDTFGVVIQVRDDGKGLDPDKLLQKAREKNLVKPDVQLSKEQIFQLIFLPGFSTAEKITDVSGRGVGMDVVMRSLIDLQGTIRIASEKGKGTSFFITLPTSVSIIEGMIIILDQQKYVVPVNAIEEVIDVKSHVDLKKSHMFQLRNQVLPVESMSKVISLRGAISSVKPEALLICKHGHERMALAVDSVLGQQQVVIRPLNENIEGVFGLLGGTILGDGEPGLILDVPAIASKYIQSARPKEIAA